MRGGFLFNGNGGRQSFDRVDVRFLHQLQKLARIGGKALHITALPLGVNRVESQRRLPRARKPGNDRQFVFGNAYVYVFKVVLSGPFDFNIFFVCHFVLSSNLHNIVNPLNKGK